MVSKKTMPGWQQLVPFITTHTQLNRTRTRHTATPPPPAPLSLARALGLDARPLRRARALGDACRSLSLPLLEPRLLVVRHL